jgi:hypothetical protein
VLSAQESESAFGVPLYSKGIQPIWLEIRNDSEEPLWFLPYGTDPEYFSPLEAAYMSRSGFSKKAKRKMEQYFWEQAMGLQIGPGGVRSGFVFTHLDLGTKNFNVDLVGEDKRIRAFTFFISVPGLRMDHQEVDWEKLYSKDEMVSYDGVGLRKALEKLPCCTTDPDGKNFGEPLNLVIVGTGEDLHRALIRTGWNETETGKRTLSSKSESPSLLEDQEKYSPVSPLYFSGRPQDAAFRKTRNPARESVQLRLWLSPMTHEGVPVWVGQISRAIKGRASDVLGTEPDVDEARDYILGNLVYAQSLAKHGYVKGVGHAPISEPRENLTGDPYFTDGYRAVLWVSGEPISFTEVEVLEWEIPPRD